MKVVVRAAVLCLALGIVMGTDDVTQNNTAAISPEESSSDWGIGTIRGGFEAVNGYFDSFLELLGGRNGVCQYKCRYGKAPLPRPDYNPPEPNGCSSYFLGLKVPESSRLNGRNIPRISNSLALIKYNSYRPLLHFRGHSGRILSAELDMGIPAMTKCCNQLDICYDTCGANKYRCDAKFRWCLHSICSDLKKSLGFVSKVEACESMADTVFNTVWTLGCKPFMNSQRASCICNEEEKDEL